MTIPTPIVNKPYVYNFDKTTLFNDNTTKFNLSEKLEIYLITEKFNRSLRPIPINPYGKPIPKPHKDLSILYLDPGVEVIRNDINKYKKIPHKDYIPVYTPPYKTRLDEGFNNMNHNNIFRKE
jgi:hypothetical protein